MGEAEDGLEAVSRIDALAPDLVFLDIQMPALSGLEVAARLQAPRPRIVFCTAFDRFAVDAFELHAVDYLLKPVNRDRLARTVERIGVQIAEQQRSARERNEAVRTQMRLMPAAAPGESGLECAGACVPADGVGGDYYDFLPLGSGRLGIALGDVSGKGMYAGLLAAAVQARLQAITARGGESPAAVMTELNRLTAGTIEANRFATVFFGAFDAESSSLTYANAGHPPAIVLSANGDVRMLDATGAVVGWSADAVFEQRSVTLVAGDVLAVYLRWTVRSDLAGRTRAWRGRPDRHPPPARGAAGAADRRSGARRGPGVLRGSGRGRRPDSGREQGAPIGPPARVLCALGWK